MTAARWADRYAEALLTQLETEANDGWPDLPWPPAEPPAVATAQQVRTLERILMNVYAVMREAERDHLAHQAEASRTTWRNTGQPKRIAA